MGKFSSLPLRSELSIVLEELGYEQLTPIQALSLSALLEGKDLIGKAQTGTGKTTAFSMPLLQNIRPESGDLQALVICPTRELSAQVAREIRKLGRRIAGLQVLVLAGGTPIRPQIESLKNGANVVVGTPGRILDLIERQHLNLAQVQTLVLDEADKMLEMGFEIEVSAILDQMSHSPQTLFFSATFPESILTLSRKYQNSPVQVIAPAESALESLMDHFIYLIDNDEKEHILMRILQQHPSQSTLIFCNQKAHIGTLTQFLMDKKISCGTLHGDLEQRERDRVMAMFQNRSYRILIATDVAARGLDIDQLELVINYDFPAQPEIFIHRAGRTGRAGKKGVSVTMAKAFDEIRIQQIEKLAQIKFQRPQLGFKNQFGLGASFREAAMQTLVISGGRKDKLRPGDILGALTGEAGGFQASDIGKIEIQDQLSYVAVTANLADAIINKLREGRIKGKKFPVRLLNSKV